MEKMKGTLEKWKGHLSWGRRLAEEEDKGLPLERQETDRNYRNMEAYRSKGL